MWVSMSTMCGTKAQLSAIGDMRPGSLTQQYKEDPGSRSGPYYQLSYTLDRHSQMNQESTRDF